jgi:hypothetical protein
MAVVAADADSQRCLDDPLDLLVQELPGAVLEAIGLAQALPLGEAADRAAGGRLTHHDEAPGLHQPHRRGAVGGAEDPLEHLIRYLLGAVAAHVAALGDHPVDGIARLGGKAPPLRVAGPVLGA